MFTVLKTLQYRGIDILLLQQEEDPKIYIPRDCVRRALRYDNSGQLSKMQSRYNKIFELEYIRDFSIKSTEDNIIHSSGLYTIRGVIEVCSHTQKFRGADTFLNFLKHEMKDLDDAGAFSEIQEMEQVISMTLYEKSERELLTQMNITLTKIEKLMQAIYDRVFVEEKTEE